MAKLKKIRKYKIHKEGVSILLYLFVFLAGINAVLYFCAPTLLVVVAVPSFIVYLLIVNFFRSPRRIFPEDDTENLIVAPADGRIVAIEEVVENEYFHEKRMQVSIFMSLLNVHANWYPVDGKVIYTAHHKGRFQAAYLPKSSTENERSTVVLETQDGIQILVRQIAGAMARRIVTYAKPGDDCNIEEHMGFIKFGSRVDVFLPLNTEIKVKMEQRVTGCCTILAELKNIKNN